MMTSEQRKLNRIKDFEQAWGKPYLRICDEVMSLLLSVDDLHTAVAIVDLAKAKLSLRLAGDESELRRRTTELVNPVTEFVPRHTTPEKEQA